jgi:hypothetical protein
MAEDNYRDILKRVGVALIVFGAIDIGYMIYCIMHRLSYSSSFNLFAVITGIYVWRAHPWYLKLVPRAAAFYVGGFTTALLILPILIPWDLQLTVLRIYTLDVCIDLVVAIAVIAFIRWIYQELRAPSVLRYYEQTGLPTGVPKYAFLLGAAIPISLAVLMYFMAHSADAGRATELAQARTGPGYRYWVAGVSRTNERRSARVYAYNRNEIKGVGVEW